MVSINITIPARNEEMILEKNLRELLDFCHKNIAADDWLVVLVDSASTDKTEEIGQRLSATEPRLKYICNNQQGKGRAIRAGWNTFPADYYVFMDADLSTDLEALPRLIQELKNGADVVIGSRYLPESQTQRSLIKLFISKTYRLLAHLFLGLPWSDLPCGFKGINHRVATELLPRVKNEEWFFDTELLYHAWKKGRACHSERNESRENRTSEVEESLLPNLRDSSTSFQTVRQFRLHSFCHPERSEGSLDQAKTQRDSSAFGLRMTVKEIPVRWTETPNAGRKSRVGILRVSWNYIKEMIKLKTSPR